MLEHLLSELRSGRTNRVEELAVSLNTTPAMVQVMLDHLVKLDMVKRYRFCDSSCSTCSAGNFCYDDPDGQAGLYYIETNQKNT